jgi:putative restriction endonuclease
MSNNLASYAKKFSNLRVDRSRGIAPHKPILVLSVINLFERDLIRRNQIALSPELVVTFLKYWHQLGSNSHNADIAMPFFHLTGDGFWHLKAKPGYESVLSSKVKLRSVRALREFIQYAYLDEELFKLLRDEIARKSLINVIVEAWFPEKKKQVQHLLKIDSFQEFQDRLREQGGAVYKVEDLQDEAQSIVRDAAFRRIVVSVYGYRCAFCGLQVINSLSQNILDGAHIKPFAEFFDDRIDNGISLCKNHHWAFDCGWFTIVDDYTILVSNDLREESLNAKPMREFQGNRILLPVQEQYQPRLEALRWHRENVFNCQ